MLPTFIIMFREILEISIILSIIVAATKGVAGRGRWIWAGIGGGLAGAGLVALFTDAISEWMEGMGQELFNACVLLAAAVMIGWTVIWMQRHGREIATRVKKIGVDVAEGNIPLYSVAIVVSLAMWREGSEIVLFLFGVLSTQQYTIGSILVGGAGGTIAAASIGLLMYYGLIKLSVKYLFTVSGVLLMLLACGMAASGAGYLAAAGVIPELASQVWDSSWLLSQSSAAGAILHALIGYADRPSGIQLAFYVATLITILSAQRVVNHGASWKLKPATATALIAGTWASVAAVSAYAQVGM